MSEPTPGPTPGPWFWLNYPDGRKLLVGPDNAVIHCPDAPIGASESDQHLIAAAPDMLRELKRLEWSAMIRDPIGDTVEGCPACRNHEYDGHKPDCTLDAALRKARGE